MYKLSNQDPSPLILINMDNGWIKLHRKLLEWGWFSDLNTLGVFIYFLLSANFEPTNWRSMIIQRGQHICSHETIAKKLHISIRNVRTAILHLKLTGELTVSQHSKFGLYTLTNYNLYQTTDSQSVSQATGNRQATDNTIRSKEEKEIKKENPPLPLKPDKKKYGNHVSLSDSEFQSLKEMMSVDDLNALIERMNDYCAANGKRYKDYAAALRNWYRDRKPDLKPVTQIEKPKFSYQVAMLESFTEEKRTEYFNLPDDQKRAWIDNFKQNYNGIQ